MVRTEKKVTANRCPKGGLHKVEFTVASVMYGQAADLKCIKCGGTIHVPAQDRNL